ncbi:hypothetical protein B0T16DRAFT_457027 [Cercophora newfieldiana]|uniref:Glyoxalase/fosfomycin resistance/dioxygenase domain-containing protein n=1 Tax=Cercophora newfieldiana TaxID=92897 RepID=A0AA39YDR9_9PEZI|nr:hypothetical protein B0T16DRAFT_457027 [Cercophora newfieldiana]
MDHSKQEQTSSAKTESLPKFQSISPVFGVLPENLTRWLEHYKQLGFEVRRYGDIYGYATRDGIQLHVSTSPHHDPLKTAGCAYLYVEDADAVHAVWSKVEDAVRHVAPADTPYGLREGAHIDPDGNLIRYGSRITDKAKE